MKSLVTLLVISMTVDAKLGESQRKRGLSPKSVGAIHQEAFAHLGKKYSKEKPSSQIILVEDVANFVSSFCPDGDSSCVSSVHKTSLDQYHSTRVGLDESLYSDDLDSKVKEILDKVYDTIDLVNEHNIDEVVNKLSTIENELEHLKDVDEKSQMIGIASVSVAIESSKLWHSAFIDITHPLHDMIGYFSVEEGGRRRTQLPAFNTSPVSQLIRPDVQAAANFNISGPIDFVRIIAASISASLSGAVVSAPVIMDMGNLNRSNSDAGRGPLRQIIKFFQAALSISGPVSKPLIMDINDP